MKSLKKAATLIMAAALAVTMLGACSGKTESATTTAAPETAATTAATTASSETAAPETTAQEESISFVEEGYLNMATNAAFPPYEYKDGDGYAGIDVEIATEIAKKLGVELKINDVEFGSIIGGVQSGKYDMGMAGMTVTEERLKSINFSESYATGVQVVIVKEDSAITSIDGLSGVKIGVQQDTTGDIYCSDEFGSDNVVEYLTGADAVQALVAGKVDAVVIDNEPAKSYVAANSGLKILETAYAVEEYAICISKENTALLEKVNAALAELKADGTLQAIVDKYISAE